jgi:hypothetical protein
VTSNIAAVDKSRSALAVERGQPGESVVREFLKRILISAFQLSGLISGFAAGLSDSPPAGKRGTLDGMFEGFYINCGPPTC